MGDGYVDFALVQGIARREKGSITGRKTGWQSTDTRTGVLGAAIDTAKKRVILDMSSSIYRLAFLKQHHSQSHAAPHRSIWGIRVARFFLPELKLLLF
jgi:hypothetical protein